MYLQDHRTLARAPGRRDGEVGWNGRRGAPQVVVGAQRRQRAVHVGVGELELVHRVDEALGEGAADAGVGEAEVFEVVERCGAPRGDVARELGQVAQLEEAQAGPLLNLAKQAVVIEGAGDVIAIDLHARSRPS